jgi:hypothetical protein
MFRHLNYTLPKVERINKAPAGASNLKFYKKIMTAKKEIQQFKREFASLRGASAEKRAEFDNRFRTFIRSKTPEEKKIYTAAFKECAKEEVKRGNDLAREINLRLQLEDILKIVSWAYISETYFHKSRPWFIQRLNNNYVNGVPASFSKDELNILSNALDEIGTKMKDLSRSILY